MNATDAATLPPESLMSVVRRRFTRLDYAVVPAGLTAALLLVSALIDPAFLAPSNIATTLAVSAPYVLIAMAQAPPMLSGNGGLDLSVGPVLGFTTVLIASELVPRGVSSPMTLIPLVLLFGLLVGALNGVLVAFVRLPAIIATLATYLIFRGLAAEIMPTPGGEVPQWLIDLTGNYGPIPGVLLVYAAVGLLWFGLTRSFVRNLLAVGGDDKAAYTSGVKVAWVRVGAFMLCGMLAALAGMMLTGVIRSGDATVGSIFTVSSLTAVFLGGISLHGGRGGLLGAALGGAVYYLIQHLLTVGQVSVFLLQIVSGSMLIIALGINGALEARRKRQGLAAAALAGT